MNDEHIRAQKTAAVQFLEQVVKGNIDEAYQKFIDMNGRHHNHFFPAGFASLQKAMKENHVQFPAKRIAVKNVLADGDLVAVHSELTLKSGGDRMTVVHIFRFKDNMITELWDCGQQIPADSPNGDGAF